MEKSTGPTEAGAGQAVPATIEGQAGSDPLVLTGTCYVFFAYDIGLAVDLVAAERTFAARSHRERFRRQRKMPSYFQYEPPPVRIVLEQPPLRVGEHTTAPTVEAVIYDFGAVSVTFQFPVSAGMESLLSLGEELYDNADLLDRSRDAAMQILEPIRSAVTKPGLSEFVEDYTIYHIREVKPRCSVAAFLDSNRGYLAQILRAERIELSEQETTDALAYRIAFGQDDLAVVDWNSAIVLDEAIEDTRAVLEYANVELLEMRFLDDQLDTALNRAYEMLTHRLRRGSIWPDPAVAALRRLAELQMDNAAQFEGVNNALKLLGDQYLARLYRLAAQRLHLNEWDGSILRKLGALESACEKVTTLATHRRAEFLEWIIIILIAGSIGIELLSLLMKRVGG